MLISVEGDVGSGKTLIETYAAVLDSRPVYSNYRIAIDRYHELKPEMLLRLPYGALICLDEAYAWIESRLSGRASNRYFSYVVFQSRKKGLDIIMTNQLLDTVDVRFRKMVSVDIQCEAVDIGYEYVIQKMARRRVYKPKTWTMPHSIAEKLYPLYDSWEPIESLEDDLMLKVTKDKTDVMAEVDKHSGILTDKYPIKNITKGIVADYCLREEVSKSYVELVYNAVRARAALLSDD